MSKYIDPEDIERDDEGYPIPKGSRGRTHSGGSVSSSKVNMHTNSTPTHLSQYEKNYKGRASVIQIKGLVVRETDSAVLIKFHENMDPTLDIKTEWFPLSQVKSMSHYAGKDSVITVSEWIVKQKGIL